MKKIIITHKPPRGYLISTDTGRPHGAVTNRDCGHTPESAAAHAVNESIKAEKGFYILAPKEVLELIPESERRGDNSADIINIWQFKPEELIKSTPEPTPELVKSLRLAHGISQERAAEIMGLESGRIAIYKIESDKRGTDKARLLTYMLAMGCHPEFELVRRKKQP